jgi:hypothetical protein
LQGNTELIADHFEFNNIDAAFTPLDLADRWLIERKALP